VLRNLSVSPVVAATAAAPLVLPGILVLMPSGAWMAAANKEVPEFKITAEGRKGEAVKLGITGQAGIDNLLAFRAQLEKSLSDLAPASLKIDLSGLEYIDSAAALALVELKKKSEADATPFEFVNASTKTKGVLGLIEPEEITQPPLRAEAGSRDFFTQVGRMTREIWQDVYNLHVFLGELLRALAYCFRHPGTIRWLDVFNYMVLVGADALPILGLMSIAIGSVLAFLSAMQLKLLGATSLVAALISVAVVQELGPFLTAILVSGRSGSAFAAEIGTMKVEEEVDALVAMGFDPIRFLAVPKVLAIIAVMPLLTLYSMLFAIFGGFLVGITLLDFTMYGYFYQTMKNITLFDVFASLVKSVIFALIVAGIGCQRGFQVRGGAEAVGAMTTSAVVTSLFIVVMVESIIAIVLYYIRPLF
jgi:phospholipid/cholesterol/gamma-HCH transport system permease protein